MVAHGVGSGKTYTMANVIARTGRPALVLAPNKTLAAQLVNEFPVPLVTGHRKQPGGGGIGSFGEDLAGQPVSQ